METKVKLSCPFCGAANDVDLNNYYTEDYIGLMTICDKCDRTFGFDVETVHMSHTFPVN